MTSPHALSIRIGPRSCINRSWFRVAVRVVIVLPSFPATGRRPKFLLADQHLHRIDDRIGEQGDKHRIEREGADCLAGVHLPEFALQGDDDQPADDERAELEERKRIRAGCRILRKLKVAVKRTTAAATIMVPNVFFMICLLLIAFLLPSVCLTLLRKACQLDLPCPMIRASIRYCYLLYWESGLAGRHPFITGTIFFKRIFPNR